MPYKTPADKAAHERERYRRDPEKVRKRNAEHYRTKYPEKRAKLRALKRDQSCQRCGHNDPRVLDFHHRDPSTKSFSVATGIWSKSWDVILEEVAKCDLLCANCHRIEHYQE